MGCRKGIQPVKKLELWGCWGVIICLERDADLFMAQLMPLPLTVSCFSEIQIGFTFLVPSYLGCLSRRAVKRVCVCIILLLMPHHMVSTNAACCCSPVSMVCMSMCWCWLCVGYFDHLLALYIDSTALYIYE